MNTYIVYGVLGLLALLGLVTAIYLAVGLFQARSLLRRELGAYFLSPIAYVVLVVFLAVTGHLFYLTQEQLTASGPKGVEFPLQLMLGDERFWLVFLFIPPLLTMRLFAEERGTGTLEMLMTAPVKDWQVVLSKYVACLTFYAALWLPTLAYLPVLLNLGQPVFGDLSSLEAAQKYVTPWTITFVSGLAAVLLGLLILWPRLGGASRVLAMVLLLGGALAAGVGGWGHYYGLDLTLQAFGQSVHIGPHAADEQHLLYWPAQIDPRPVLSSYLGLALVGAMFLAIGLLISSLVRSQMVAALLSLVVSLLFVVAGAWRPHLDTGGDIYRVVSFFSVPLHFHRDFSRGLVDSRPLVLYGSVALFCLFLTVRSLESRRWK